MSRRERRLLGRDALRERRPGPRRARPLRRRRLPLSRADAWPTAGTARASSGTLPASRRPGSSPGSKPGLPLLVVVPLMLSDDLVAEAPVSPAAKERPLRRPCCDLTPARPQPARKRPAERNPCQAAVGPAVLRHGQGARHGACQWAPPRTSHCHAPCMARSPIRQPYPRLPSAGPTARASLYVTTITSTWHGFLSVASSSRLLPLPPQRGRPPGPAGQPPPPAVAHVFGAARGPPSNGVPCSSAEAASDTSALVMPDRATCCDVLDRPAGALRSPAFPQVLRCVVEGLRSAPLRSAHLRPADRA